MKQVFDLKDFKETGVSWPFKLQNISNIDLEHEYFEFQKKAKEKLNHAISLKPNLLSTLFDSMVFDTEVVRVVKAILGDDIYAWSSAFFPKEPKNNKIVSYHQDNPYWQLSTSNVVSIWIALTKSDKKSGALEVVPHSSKLGLINDLDVKNPRESYLKGEKTTDENDMLSYKQNLQDFIKKNKPLHVELSPGEFSVHHVNTVHGSGPNISNNHRIGFAIRYISSDTIHLVEKNDSAIHVCGKKNTFLEHEERPKISFSAEAIKEYQKAMNSAGAFGNKIYTK